MKTNYKVSLMLLIALSLFQSCGDDENPAKEVLIVGSMITGQFYTVDTKDGTLTELFQPTYMGDNLLNVRSIVYHPGEKKYFASLTREGDAMLMVIDPTTKVATVINDNSDVTPWRQISSLFVASDDSLFAVGDFDDLGEGFTKFGTDGQRSTRLIINSDGMCCGYGMIYFSKQKEIVVSNGENQDYDGTVDLDIYDKNGVYQSTTSISDLVGFPEDLTSDFVALRSMASQSDSNSGTIYGVMIAYELGKSYIVKVDLENESITWIGNLDTVGDYDFAPLTFVSEKVANK